MKKIIQEEMKYYEQGLARMSGGAKTYKELYSDKAKEYAVRRNTDLKKGFLGYHSELEYDMLKYGKSTGEKKLVFGNSGIENIIPYVFEVDLIATWTSHFKTV